MYTKLLRVMIISDDTELERIISEADPLGDFSHVIKRSSLHNLLVDEIIGYDVVIFDTGIENLPVLVKEYRQRQQEKDKYVVFCDRNNELFDADTLAVLDAVWAAPFTDARILFQFKKLQQEIKNIKDIVSYEAHNKMQEKFKKVLEQDVAVKARTISDIQQKIYLAFANIIDLRDKQTGTQLRYTSYFTKALIAEMVKEGRFPELMDKEYAEAIVKGSLVHDIGMFVLPDNIIFKNGRYTDEDRRVMQQHTIYGKKMLDRTLAKLENFKGYKVASDMTLYHHERFDGSGYPKGLAGKDIPLSARIMAVVDAFSALITPRSYRMTYTVSQAYSLMKSNAGAHFDLDIMAAFIMARPEIEKIVNDMVYKIGKDQ